MRYSTKDLMVILILFIVTIKVSFCQNETNNWYFGNKSGLNFNYGQVSQLTDSAMDTPAGCSTISDENGMLLFYTNGQTIWNRNHQIMTNGEDLNAETTNFQSSIIIPDPNDELRFFVLTTRTHYTSSGIYYTTVVFDDANPDGVVTSKNVKLTNSSTERISAVYSPQTNSVKAIGLGKINPFNDTTYQALFIINIGVFGNFTTSTVSLEDTVILQYEYINKSCGLKISPNGQYIAIGDSSDTSTIKIYNYDIISNSVTYFKGLNAGYIFTPVSVDSIEFSADSEVLYFTGNFNDYSYLHKFELNSGAPFTEKELIDYSSDYRFGGLQLASNSKIYIANYLDSDPHYFKKISVINKPDNYNDIGYINHAITLVNHSTKGLPNFVTSFMRNRIITENRCVDQTFNFNLDAYDTISSVNWDFGDGNTSNALNPSHNYLNAGIYTVRAEITVNNNTIKLYKIVEAYPLPEIDDNMVFSQCDINNSGTSTFNLYQVENFYNGDPRDDSSYDIKFYNTFQDANNEINPIDNPESYQNNSNPEQIFVNITSIYGCKNIDSFNIEVNTQQLIELDPLVSCEDSDNIQYNNIGRFNLLNKAQEIASLLNLPTIEQINFYPSYQDALSGTNVINDNNNPLYNFDYDSINNTIWVIINQSNGSCGAIANFDLIVNSAFNLDILPTYQMCFEDEYIQLDAGIENDTWTWYDNQGNVISNNRIIQITQPGNYNVEVSRTENNLTCYYTTNFNIQAPNYPTFNNLNIDGTTLNIDVIGESNYEFSLDNVNFYGNSNAYTFYNVEPGIIDVYVRDIYNCEADISKQISFIQFPKYFTPNNDRVKDIWTVKGINSNTYKSAYIEIYNRYGKRLYAMSLKTIDLGWNGIYNGKKLPSDDYWFKAELITTENKVINKTGHFTLKY
ncbi:MULTISPECIES: T9SS type B sorting domain-containing protein [Mesoflavibacter]|uniref:T9SS type B sorting domain-containing protein n=1 Tax=Mesoflavibacter profundi TaxID=2708110 RepID=A0ABT4S0R9_9FLAO|nr:MULTISPECIES: T9SS type B sorting domain-containing protein [Mesoflavibacter]MDA0177493.1 T9SS type B sorting domain-containing protein [Mesoflavibacter profundi]QIJ88448.1 hypothetical protein C7H62_0639 [Mesoflavibacter sp. HG96]QIJ91176.1 hypothetical protein C7H56_0639 [Mesoflavibacter sp. HG37]